MAKLTEAQKQENKAARKILNAAYLARCKLYQAAVDSTKAQAMSEPVYAERVRADAESDAKFKERDQACAAIQAKIDELKEQLKQTEQKFNDELEVCRTARSAAWAAFNTRQNSLREAVDAQFPDMVDCYSLASWVPPTETPAK